LDRPEFQILNFYEFKRFSSREALEEIKLRLKELMSETGVRGTIILAEEGFNASVCGTEEEVAAFLPELERVLDTKIDPKISLHDNRPLRKIDVKIKPEIVTLKQEVDMTLAEATHVKPEEWNALISDPETFILDTRNDYEYLNGTFKGATNPQTEKFSDLPEYVEKNLDPEKHKRIAMFCTGGIRCEKFAPYMKGLGFKNVFQLEGGILRYIEQVPAEESMWEGECFVFDERRTLTHELTQGSGPDYSLRGANKKAAKAGEK
jgi:UPF0176 protein